MDLYIYLNIIYRTILKMRETLWSLFVSERFHWSVSTRLTTSSCTRSTARSASSSTPWTGALTTETVRLCVRGEELGTGGGGVEQGSWVRGGVLLVFNMKDCGSYLAVLYMFIIE